MFNRCKHIWEEQRRYGRPPANRVKVTPGFKDEPIQDVIYGWTMIELRCKNCGDIQTKKIRYTG